MGLLSKWFLGVDVDEEQRRTDAANARILELNQAAVDSGRITQGQFDAASLSIASDGGHDYAGQVRESFYEGLDDGANNIRGAASFSVSLIPWWIYVAVAAVALIYFWPVLKKLSR